MVVNLRPRRALAVAGLLLAGGVTLAACSGPSHPAAATATGIVPGAGQSLAGQPGATGTGADPGAGGSAMPGMTMSGLPTAPGSGAPAAPVAGNSVAIQNFAFAPAALVVKVGTTVTWTNRDTDAHTVTSQNNSGPLASSALSTGQSYSYTFTKPGRYDYLCTIHPFMTATVTVTP
jgi:plastocyanin